MRRRSLLVLLALGAPACGSARDAGSAAPPPEPPACGEAERPGEDGACELFATRGPCAPGTRQAIGSDACVPVGTTTCAAGFEPDASGWGCAPVLPDAPCAGATRPALGSRACVPVGDCSRAFPPAGAIVVDPSLDAGSIDATHVRTLADAIAAAPAGATIALVDGVHETEGLQLHKSVTVEGRCAERARLAPSATARGGLGVKASATLRGLSLSGFTSALTVLAPGELTLEDVVVSDARFRGLVADRGGVATVRRSVVRGTRPVGASDQTMAVAVGGGGRALIEESAVLDSVDGAVLGTDGEDTRVELLRSVVQDTRPRPDGAGGSALRAFEGARLDVTESAVLGSTGMAVLTLRRNKPAPRVTIARSVVAGTRASAEGGASLGTAINAAYDAKVGVSESTVADSEGTALYAAESARIDFAASVIVRVRRTKDRSSRGASALKGATVALDASAIVDVGGLGAGGWDGGHLTIARSLVSTVGGDVVRDEPSGQDVPMGQGLNVTAGATLEATDTTVVDAREIGVAASNARTRAVLDRVLVTRTEGSERGTYGHGLLSVDVARIDLARSIVELQPGVALFFASGGGTAQASLVRQNAIAVQVQEGSSLVEADVVPDEVGPAELVVASSTTFSRNASRVGSAVLPLPAPLERP